MKLLISLSLFFGIVIANGQAVDSEKSTIDFEVRNFRVKTVKGTLSGLSGNVIWNENSVENSSLDFKIPVKTINTGIEKRDEHLLQEDYFDAANHPKILFKSKKIWKTDNGYKVSGSLTVKGISKEVEIPISISNEGQRKAINAEFSIDRTNFEVGGNGGFAIGKDIKIKAKCLLKE